MTYMIGAIVVVILVVVVLRKSRYYSRIFNDDHYGEIARWAVGVIEKHPVENPREEDGTAFLTSAGLALIYTSENRDGNRVVHFSVSQRTGYTTHAVGNRVLFLLIRLLHRNPCEAELFRTESSVHHAEFSMPADSPWLIEPAEDIVSDMENCPNLPIETVKLARPGAPANDRAAHR